MNSSDGNVVASTTTSATASAPSHRGLRTYLPMIAIALGVLVIDQITKAWANGDWIFSGLDRCNSLVERPALGFCLAFNEGMAFSIGWGSGALISIVVVSVIVTLAVFSRNVSLAQRLVMGAIVGGALGNLIDRGLRPAAPGTLDRGFMGGAVVDFIYSRYWAT
ncbi:MAG TPA: signal peptidase II, partial [Microthrixaceae bacterium]|nr:signal peptidase II [Microthrixaceae bacterium]